MNEPIIGVDPLTTVGDPDSYFQQIEDGFEAVVRAHADQLVEQDFRLAGQLIRTRIVGTELAEALTRPLAHLRIAASDQSPALRWDCWDEAVTGLAYPPPPDEIILRQSVDNGIRFCLLGRNQVDMAERKTATRWIHGRQRHVLGWYESAQACPISERTRPLMEVLPVWLPTTGAQMFHSALVAVDGRGAMLIGESGAGKTTTALTCLTDGLDFLADDHCAVRVDADGVTGYSLFSAARLFPEDLDRFPALRPVSIIDTGEDKALTLLYPAFERQLRPSVPLRALLLPRQVSGDETRVVPATAMQVALALMPSMRLLTPEQMPHGFQRYMELAGRLPCYWLELGRDPVGVSGAIAALLQSLDA